MVFISYFTSSIVGIETAAPALEQVMADAFDASSSEAGIFLPCNSPDKKNPVNVSPAAVVSTAFILKAG